MSNHDKKDFLPFTKREEQLMQAIVNRRQRAETRYPLLTGLFATFGFVSVLYGFEKMIDKISFLSGHPSILLGLGLLILAVTGTVYQKLS